MSTTDTPQNKSHRLSARQGRWEQIGEDCKRVRQKVFIEEQQIPADEEWDAEDALSEHFLLLLNDRPVATARLTSQGSIGRLAVLKAVRGKGLGEKIMQRVLEHCRRTGLKKVTLNAQISALNFYLKLGFKIAGEEYLEVGIPHLPMELSLIADLTEETHFTAEDLQQALTSTQELRLQGKAQIQLAIEVLTHQAARSVSLEAPNYPARWFSDQALEPLLSLARRHQHSRVECIFAETLTFSRQPSNLLKLHQRAPTHIKIRKAYTANRQAQQAFLLIDDKHLIWWPHFQEPRAELYTAEHREAFRQAQAFKAHWQRAEEVKYLQGHQL